MAKYDITHACGHQQTHVLYGKHSGFGGRDSKIEWLGGQDCKDCWLKKKREAESTAPITMTVMSNGLDKDNDGDVLAEIILTGGTYARKDQIKELGYYWQEVRGGVMDFFSTSAPQKAWVRRVKLHDLRNQESAASLKIKSDVIALDAKTKLAISALDLAMAKQGEK